MQQAGTNTVIRWSGNKVVYAGSGCGVPSTLHFPSISKRVPKSTLIVGNCLAITAVHLIFEQKISLYTR